MGTMGPPASADSTLTPMLFIAPITAWDWETAAAFRNQKKTRKKNDKTLLTIYLINITFPETNIALENGGFQ